MAQSGSYFLYLRCAHSVYSLVTVWLRATSETEKAFKLTPTTIKNTVMDASFILAAVIFTLLAIVVATSMFTGTSPSSDYGLRADGAAAKESASLASQNGHVPSFSASSWFLSPRRKQKKGKTEEFDWCEMSGSSHDHWDVVKNVLSEEQEQLSSDLSRPESRAEPPSGSSSGRSSFMGLSGSELLKCAFPLPQIEGAAERPDQQDNVESNSNHSFKYLPGKSRSHHLQMMMSKDELQEEQRVQREQLAAIFQLLKNNQDTFGDLSQGDVEEQLKLYSI
uniref:Matrix-remodeling-associated protein 7 helical domain-containing protein n=1 Tax=Neogobius melanostomus TaxID=47308 RepID=A0A8C6UIW0_9GOBI